MKTSLGEKNERIILDALEPVIQKFAKKVGQSADEVKRSVAYLWQDASRQAQQDRDDYLSANEIGPYGGR